MIAGAYGVLHRFEHVRDARDSMCAMTLDEGEAQLFARCALVLKYDDHRPDLWSVFNRAQENLTKDGLSSRRANGRRQHTRPVQGIDSDIRLNRALWLLADGMRYNVFRLNSF